MNKITVYEVKCERRKQMKKKEAASLIRYGITSAVASLAAVGTFWWLAKYSLLNERDIVGTSIVVWCAVAARVLIWAEKSEEIVK